MQFPDGPVEMWLAGVRTAQVMVEAQAVATLRLLGTPGLWPDWGNDALRMLREAPGAFVQSGGAAMVAALSGKRPDQVAEAAIRPLGQAVLMSARRPPGDP